MVKKQKNHKTKRLLQEIADERHERIMAELMYDRALGDLAARTPLGFKNKKKK